MLSCSKDDGQSNTEFGVQPFVRFNFLVNSNNIPLEYPALNSGLVPRSTYNNTLLKPIKIPVTLTSTTLSETVSVTYSTTPSNGIGDFNVSPANQLTFQGNQLTDTIFVSFDERWTPGETITFKLEEVSDTSINIGNLNAEAPNDIFILELGEISATYSFEQNRIEVIGQAGEELNFKVNFPNGYLLSEIEDEPIFEFLNGFDYTLNPINAGENPTSITYKLTLNENIQNDAVFYQTIITLLNTANYNAIGNTVLQIVKPINTPRDPAVNTASNFYNLSDPLYRTYGENWGDFNSNGICNWSSFFAFTFPVVVSADSPNAVLFNDMGTPDPSDDIYHDAFKIGFGSTNTTGTTNSFNLKRWFTNESISAANSPGFNVNPALEFFPDNGDSSTSGTVLVIPQFITITGTNGNSYSIAISGEGTYHEISPGLMELSFILVASNEALFGGSINSEYKIYNSNTYPDPDPLTNICVSEYDL